MIERKIIIGLITSTEYCNRIQAVWNPMLLESATAKQMSNWVWDYFREYKKAPNKDIEGIFYSKLKTGKLQKDLAEEIEQDILPSLSEEYTEEEQNVDYLVIETERYLSERHITLHNEAVDSLLAAGKVEEAQQLIHEFKPLSSVSAPLDNYILSMGQIKRKNRPKPITLLRPWLKEGQMTIIYGNYGTGKSLLSIAIGYVLGLREPGEDSDIGEWRVKNQTGCLYIDGELGEQELEERVNALEWLGPQSKDHKMRILSIPDYQLETEDSFYLSDRKNQRKIIDWLQNNPNYKLIILDSASTLFGLKEENDNSEWNLKINPFVRDLRALGVACILLHHAGKDGRKGLRGASAMGAMAHNIFRLLNHTDKDIDDGEAWFVLAKDKQRSGGFSFKTFSLQFTQENHEKETHWEVTRTGKIVDS